MPMVTALYAALLGLMSLVIGFHAGRLRGRLKVSVGDGGNPDLLLAMRRHANFAEWVPLALVIIALLEMSGAPRMAVHALGATLVIARAAHAIGIQGHTLQGAGRFVGAAGTALVILVASVWTLVKVL